MYGFHDVKVLGFYDMFLTIVLSINTLSYKKTSQMIYKNNNNLPFAKINNF